MKRISLILIVLLSLFLASCSGTADSVSTTTNSDAYVSPSLDVSYENALSARLQLTLGSLKLAETNTPITPDQAKVMLPLWQALLNMTRTGNSAQAEVNALLGQIEAAFTPEQLTAIRDMKLVSDDIQTWAAANNVTVGSGGGQGNGQGGGGMSPEARATKQAAEGVTSGSSGNGVSTVMLNSLITYLQGLAQ
ncbi:MAG: hypothetical protein C4583_11885 [Anaerolineaceae bacterium]|nr:MAG: hypothetical protein C4583_11885 [Anaerolineaceae bacterium]